MYIFKKEIDWCMYLKIFALAKPIKCKKVTLEQPDLQWKGQFPVKCCNDHSMLLKLGICPLDRKTVINTSIVINNSNNLSSGYYPKYCGRYLKHTLSDGHKTLQEGNITAILSVRN